MELLLARTRSGLAPIDEASAESLERLQVGQAVRASVKRMRSYPFHKKYMALLRLAFDMWCETADPKLYQGMRIKPDFDTFRADVTVLAGVYRARYHLDGSVNLEALSISYANMGQDRFEALYSRTIDVLIQTVIPNRFRDADHLRAAVDEILRFA